MLNGDVPFPYSFYTVSWEIFLKEQLSLSAPIALFIQFFV